MNARVFRALVFLAIFSFCAETALSQTPSVPTSQQTSPAQPSVQPVAPAAVPLEPSKAGVVPLSGSAEANPTSGGEPAAQKQSAPEPTPAASVTEGGNDLRYRVGGGDVLEIRVLDRPTLSRDAVRVDASGLVRMPLIRHDISVICKTEAEISDSIAKEYSEYLKDPQVSVFVKEFNAQPVSLVGAVQKPGGYQLQRRIRLRELLMIAGGPGTTAGGVIQIMHDDSSGSCDTGEPQHRMMSLDTPDVTLLKLDDVMHAMAGSNPFVRPGDFINLPEANQAYVVGNVFKPTSIALNGTITISRAIAMAGGALPNSKSQVRLLRLNPDKSGNREILIPIKSVERNMHEDLALQAGDIVEIPLAQGKLILKSVLTTFTAGALLSYPLTVIR